MTPTPQAIENAARAIYTATPRNRPYEQLSLWKKEILRAQATKVLTDDLGDMVLVPREPTNAMLVAAIDLDEIVGGALYPAHPGSVYRAMIAAAEDER